jgi:hypothetical protein
MSLASQDESVSQMSFWMFIKAAIRALLNKSSQLTGPA